jgi:hypothetical protein
MLEGKVLRNIFGLERGKVSGAGGNYIMRSFMV